MSESQLANLFLEQSNDLIWIIDSNFCLKYANQAYQNVMKQVTGEEKKNDESIFTEGFGEGSTEKWKAYYERGLKGEQFEIEENFYNPHTNQVEFSEISFKPLTDENQVVVNVACQSRDITSHIKTNTEAEKLLDASLDVICSIDAQGNFIKLNDACKDLWGYEKDELIGKAYIDFVIEEDVEKTNQAAADTIDGKLLTTFENRYKRKDGGIAFNLWSARWDPESQIMFCVARDGREKIKKEELLIESENRFKSLVQEGSDMISIIDAAGTYMYTSPTTTAILGITPEEFDGNTVFDFIHPDDVERAASYMQRITTERKVLVEPFRLRDGNKEWRWIETVLTNMMDNPAIRGYVSNSRDITAKKVEEQRLKLLERVITNTNDAVLITEAEPLDQPGPRIVYVNEAFTKMTGYTAEEVIGKTPRILQGPKSDKVELAKLSKALRNWEPCEITTVNYKKNGEEFWINFSVSPVADETGWYTHWIAIERDVTEQKTKELENELVAQISSTFNLVNEFVTATKKLCEIIGLYGKLDWVELWTPNLEMTEMRLTSHFVLTLEDEIFYTHNEDTKFYKDESLIGKVWASEKQLLWDDVTKRKEFKRADSAKAIGLKSVMGIPLIYNNEVLGVLTVGVKSNSGHLKNYARIFERLEKFIGSELQRKNLEIELGHLFDTIPDIISVGDFQGKFLRINKPGCELLGYTQEEILQKGFEEFVHHDDLNICYEEIQQLQEGRDTFGFEVRFITKSGEIIWLSWYCKAKNNEGLIYCTAKNITEEKKLRELNRQTRKLAKIGSWEVDMLNQSIYWSDEVHQMHETDASSFKPTMEQAVEFYREDFRELVNQSIENSVNTGAPFDFEAVLVTANKKELWVRAIGNAAFVDGKCTSIYGSFQDISSLKETEIRLKAISNNLPGVVYQYLIFPDGTDELRYVSGAVEQLWGFTPAQVLDNINIVWDQIKAGGRFEETQISIAKSIETKSKWTNTIKYMMPNGELRTHLGNGMPSFLADGTIVFNSIVLDITQEAKNEQMLEQTTTIAKIGSWEMSLANQNRENMYWSPIVFEILKLDSTYDPSYSGGLELIMDDSQARIKRAMDALINEGKEYDEEVQMQTGKGAVKWVRLIGKCEWVNNQIIKIYGSIQDINEKKIAEEQLVSLLNERNNILESIGDAFFAVENDWVVTYWNQRAESVLGIKKEDIVGKSFWEVFADAIDTDFYTKYHYAKENMEIQNFEAFYETSNQWFEVTAYPSEDGLSVYFKDITERKIANAEIVKSEEKRRLIMNGALDAIVSIDTNETITFWNPQADVIFGWKAEEVMGKPLSEVIIPEAFRKNHVEGLKNYLKTGEGKALNVLLELSAIRKNGEEFPIELTVIPIKQGDEEFFCAFIRDITQRKINEEKLTESEREYRELALQLQLQQIQLNNAQELAKIGSWETDLSNLDVSWSDETYRIFGTDRASYETTHESFLSFVHPDDKEKVNQAFMDSTQAPAGTQHKIEHRIVTVSGVMKVVEEHWKITFGDMGEPLLAIGSCQDITERKKAEETILRANERFEKVTEATNDAIYEWNIKDNTLYWGGGFNTLFGHDVEKISPLLESWSEHIHPEDAERVTNSLNKIIESDQTYWTEEYRFKRKDGSFAHVIDRGIFIKNSKGDSLQMVGSMTDISERKHHEVELLAINEKLNIQTKELKRSNEELEQFAFVSSHDLQEPLRMITSFMELLKRNYGDQLDGKALQYIHFATDGAKRMKQIILDLLLYSRANRPAEELEKVDLNQILSDFKQLRKKVIVDNSADIQSDQLPIMKTHRAPITQVFHGILDNAIKYAKSETSPVIAIKVKEKQNAWEFSIEDNGIGIDDEFFEKIFGIFQRLHNREQYNGTGIGLAVVKRSVEFLGGTIWVTSTLGEGSTFHFTINKQQGISEQYEK